MSSACDPVLHTQPSKPASTGRTTVSLVSHDPASRDLRNTLLMKESRYSNSRHIIVTALPQSVH